jgi:outer membrane lipoprotein SlyB
MSNPRTSVARKARKTYSKYDFVYCSNCGHGCKYVVPVPHQKPSMVAAGAMQGAMLGSRVGIAAGPLGAISGVIPGAIVGAILAAQLADAMKHNPACPKCGEQLPLSTKLRGLAI